MSDDTSIKISRRGVLASGGAALGLRLVPNVASKVGGRRILTVYFDKAAGMMRAVERVVP
ncbi:hypothetical protein GCM10007939_01620 [Amylibacter marinus]|uniref:Tat (Twin-arginine translocation) pathway signal sequence n=1 Tax=Amylibacter marinus TaxID=1475483 RepID=A0ABQ5VRC0_9RHOB|nr:Tat pathway signal protein [Amylibacter marinus]GLQ33879.1 hypothetical protein GCM10007939_01620 [Amylibacter marinus]